MCPVRVSRGFLKRGFGRRVGLGEEDGMVLLAVGNSGGVGVDIGEMRNRRRRKLETASTGGIFLPSREDLVLGRYFPESTTGPPPPCLPNPPQPKKGQARPLIVNAVAPLSLTADRVSSFPIFLFLPSSCFAGIISSNLHHAHAHALSHGLTYPLLLLRDTLASPLAPRNTHTDRIMSSKNDIRMSTGSSGDEDRKLEGGESTVNGSAPSAGAAVRSEPSTTTSKADLHPAFYIAYGNDRFIIEGGFWLGLGKMDFLGFFVFC